MPHRSNPNYYWQHLAPKCPTVQILNYFWQHLAPKCPTVQILTTSASEWLGRRLCSGVAVKSVEGIAAVEQTLGEAEAAVTIVDVRVGVCINPFMPAPRGLGEEKE